MLDLYIADKDILHLKGIKITYFTLLNKKDEKLIIN